MKKMFKMFGIALLACSLLTVSCNKEEDDTANTPANNGGSTPDPNPNPNPNPNPDPDPQTNPTIEFKWDGEVQELKAINVAYRSQQEDVYYIIIDASGDAHQSGDQNLVDLPSYRIVFSYVGQNYQNSHDLDLDLNNLRVFSTETMSDDDHISMFTTPGDNNVYTLTTPDFAYVSHTVQGLAYDADANTFSGTANIVLSSVYDQATGAATVRQKTLTLTVRNYPVSPYQKGGEKTVRR